MCGEKKVLKNDDMAGVNAGDGGFVDTGNGFVPYDRQEHFPIKCPKCGSRDLYWDQGLFGIDELNVYWCNTCNHEFGYDELPCGGASDSW